MALAVDYLGPAVVPLHGWRIAPEHFAERYGLVVLIALGESVIAIGVGAGFKLHRGGDRRSSRSALVVISALWWLYFDVAAIFARRELVQARRRRAGPGSPATPTATCTYPWSPESSSSLSTLEDDSAQHHDPRSSPLPAVALCTRRGALPGRTGRIPLALDRTDLPAADIGSRRPPRAHPGRAQPARPSPRSRSSAPSARSSSPTKRSATANTARASDTRVGPADNRIEALGAAAPRRARGQARRVAVKRARSSSSWSWNRWSWTAGCGSIRRWWCQ